jgi:hypothetical protein
MGVAGKTNGRNPNETATEQPSDLRGEGFRTNWKPDRFTEPLAATDGVENLTTAYMMSLNARSEEHLKPEGIQSASCVQALRFTFVATLAS